MKKYYLLKTLLALIFLCMSVCGFAQKVVTIGEGTVQSDCFPFGNNYIHSTTESIYLSQEIGSPGVIKAISYNCAQMQEHKCLIGIYMGYKDSSVFESTQDYVNPTDLQLVYSDSTILGSSTGWVTYELQTPFVYDGRQNLVIAITKTGTYYTGHTYYCTEGPGRSLYRWNDGNNLYADINNVSIPFERSDIFANIKITLIPSFSFFYDELAQFDGFDAIQSLLTNEIKKGEAIDSTNNEALSAAYAKVDSLIQKAIKIKNLCYELAGKLALNKELYAVTGNEALGTALVTAEALINAKATLTIESLEDLDATAEAIASTIGGMDLIGTKVWDFNISQETIDGLNYDNNHNGYWSKSSSYYYTYSNNWNQYQLGYHGADGKIYIVPETEGLFFIGGNRFYVYTDGTNRIRTDGSGTSYAFKIPNLTAGQIVTINYTTSSNGSTCGITQYSGNTQLIAGDDRTTGTAEATYEVTSDGDVSFYPYNRSIYINSLSVTAPNDPWRLAELRQEVADYICTLDSFPGLKAELQTAYDKAVLAGDLNISDSVLNVFYGIYNNVKEAVRINPLLLTDIDSATAVLTHGAYVDVSEALALGQAIKVETSVSAEYLAAYDALESALAIYNADQVEQSEWAFNNSTVVTIDGLRYYLDTTNNLAEFINFNTSNAYYGTLNIPATIRYNETTYAVVAMINSSRYNQSNITSVTLPKSLRYIGDYGLGYFSNVRSIEIPENVTSMGSYIFSNSNNLTSIRMNAVVPPTVSSLNGSSYKKITIPAESFHAYRIANGWKDCVLIGGDGVTVSTGKIVAGDLGHVVLDEATYLQEVNKLIIEEGTLNNDDWNTIKSMTNLIEIDMSGVTMANLPASSFDGRWAIEKVALPHNLTTIGNYAFRSTGIKEVNFPETLTTLGDYSFQNCDSLSQVVIPAAIRSIPTCCFYDCDNLQKVEMPSTLKTISSYAFCECNRLREAALPNGLTSIGSSAFRYCPLKKIDIPSGITSISDYAFANNTALDSLVIPATVSTINSYAFSNCTSLKNVQFNEGLTNIYSYAFQNCTALGEIILPSSLERCEGAPFGDCSNLKKIEARSVIPPTTGGKFPLGNVSLNDVVLAVPSWSTSEYPLADGWSSFYTFEASDYMPQYIKVNKDFYFTLRDTLAADYRPNIHLAFSDVQSTDAYGYTNYERGNLTVSGRSKLAVNDLALEYSAFAKYYADENVYYGYDYDNYRTHVNSTSLIVNGEMRAEDVTIWLNTYNGRWQFISFPFDVKVADIKPSESKFSWVIRKHNGAQRAAGNLNAVWENTTTIRPDVTPKFSPVATDGNTIQYLYNVETGTFIVGANDWNTRVSVSEDNGYQFKVLDNGDGTYRLNDLVGSNWNAVDCDASLSSWVDGAGRVGDGEWHITSVGDNLYEITNEQAGDMKWGVNPSLSDTRVYFAEDGQASTWAFVSQDDYNAYLKDVSHLILTDTLKAGVGYIMHTYNPDTQNSWFSVTPVKNSVNRQLIFASGDRTLPLEEHLAEFDHNRSWNLIGNPYPCFYDTRFMDFDAPFMVWNSYSQNYVAYNPADDAYILSPGEAFFVQRPYDQEDITFRKEGRQTHRYAREMEVDVRQRKVNSNNPLRKVYNITLSNDMISDRTRVVFNEEAAMAYEMTCDAAKFASTEKSVPQIYTVNNNVRFAINERPVQNGDVALGVTCGSAGVYTISVNAVGAGRIILEDKAMNVSCDLSAEKGYTFNAEAGDYLGRFVLHFVDEATEIATLKSDADNAVEAIYSLQGIKMDKAAGKGIYIKNGQKTVIK